MTRQVIYDHERIGDNTNEHKNGAFKSALTMIDLF